MSVSNQRSIIKKQEYRKVNRSGYRKENKTGIGFSWNVVLPQAFVEQLGIDKNSIIRFTLNTKSLKLEKV